MILAILVIFARQMTQLIYNNKLFMALNNNFEKIMNYAILISIINLTFYAI